MRDPSQPSVRGPKVPRLVGQGEFERDAVHGGQEIRVNVVLGIVASHANGTVVLLSRDRPEATVTAWMRVPPGAKAVTLTVPDVAVERATTVPINGRAVHQLGGAGRSPTLTIPPKA